MKLFQHILTAIRMHLVAFRFMIDNKLLWFFLIPLTLIVTINGLGILSSTYISDYALQYLRTCISFDDWFPWLSVIINALLIVVLRIVLFLLFGFLGGYVILIIMSPFLAFVSEKTEQIYTGKEYPFSLVQLLKDGLRGSILAFRNICIELLIILIVFIISFIPLIGALIGSTIGAIFLFLVSAYFYGFSFIDYTNERRKYTINQSITFVKNKKGLAIGSGFIFGILLFIPFFGSYLAAFFAIIATISTTIQLLSNEDQTN